jgi:hypothetical protein
MGPLQHINDYQIEVYGHCIDDTSSTARVRPTALRRALDFILVQESIF